MGLLNQIIGAVVAEEALEKAEPGAGFLQKGMAVIAGYEGEKVLEEKVGQHLPQESQQPAADGSAP